MGKVLPGQVMRKPLGGPYEATPDSKRYKAFEALSGRQRLLGDDPHSVEWSPGGYKRQASTRTGTASGTRSCGDHLSLSVQHFFHAMSSALCGPSEPSDPDEDQGAEVKRARKDGIFLPTDKWKESWDLIVLNLIIYSAVMVPYRICFNAPATGWLDKFEISLSLLFFVDVIFNFNTAYAEGEKWVVDRPSIALRYLQGWFWIDFPSCIPVGLIDSLFAGEQDELGMLRFLRLFRLLRLLKLLRLATIVAELEDRFDLNLCFLRIMQMLLALIFLAHILACFWFYMATIVGIGPDIVTWVSTYKDGYLLEESPEAQYLASMYWALTTLTTVGYGDIVATNDVERSYAVFALLMGALVFGYMISSIASLVKALDRQGGLTEERMDEIKEYMRWRKLPRELMVRMRKYYENYYDTCTAFDEHAILGNLTPSMRLEVVEHILKDTIGKIPLFARTLDRQMQVDVFALCKPLFAVAKDIIYTRGDLPLGVYILTKGQAEAVSSMDGRSLYRVSHLKFFGTSVLTGRRYSATHRAITPCEMVTIAADDLRNLFHRFSVEGKMLYQSLLRSHQQKEAVRRVQMRMYVIMSLAEYDGTLVELEAKRNVYALRLQLAWERKIESASLQHMPGFETPLVSMIEKRRGRVVAPLVEESKTTAKLEIPALGATLPKSDAPAVRLDDLHSDMQELQRDMRMLIEQVASLSAKVIESDLRTQTTDLLLAQGGDNGSTVSLEPTSTSATACMSPGPMGATCCGQALPTECSLNTEIRAAESSMPSLHSPRCTSPRMYMARVAQERAGAGATPNRSARG